MLFSVGSSATANLTVSICATSGIDPVTTFMTAGGIDNYLDTFRAVPEHGSVIVPVIQDAEGSPRLESVALDPTHANTFISQSRQVVEFMESMTKPDLDNDEMEEGYSDRWAFRKFSADSYCIMSYHLPARAKEGTTLHFDYGEDRDTPQDLRIVARSEESRTSTIAIRCTKNLVEFLDYEINLGGVALYRLLTETLGLASDCPFVEGAVHLYQYVGVTEKILWSHGIVPHPDDKYPSTSSSIASPGMPFNTYIHESRGYRWDPTKSDLTIRYKTEERLYALDPRLLEFWTY